METTRPRGRARGRRMRDEEMTEYIQSRTLAEPSVLNSNSASTSASYVETSTLGIESNFQELEITGAELELANLEKHNRGQLKQSFGVVCTRPTHLHDKQGAKNLNSHSNRSTVLTVIGLLNSCFVLKGKTGDPIMVQANYFQLCSVTDWTLYQHHVNFSPDDDRINMRKTMIKQHHSSLGGYLFDGMIFYTSHPLPENPFVLISKHPTNGSPVNISIKFSRKLNSGSHEYMQFFNILMRKCLGSLNLQLVGRNYFDPCAKVDLSAYKMELWPGYVTSIRQHENEILLCTEITHKVMRQETVLHLLLEIQGAGDSDWQKTFKQAVLGLVVLTDYNNRTYRVDDVDYEVSPSSLFELRNHGKVSYAEYYETRYKIRITHPHQPLLVTKTKSKEVKAGLPETIYLIPEMCRMTGLSDGMRSNFRLMSALADHTRMGPRQRVQKLHAFCQRIMSEPIVATDLNLWNMSVSPTLVQIKARVLPQESIRQGSGDNVIRYPAGSNTDWTSSLRSNPMLSMKNVMNWVVIVPRELYDDAGKFIKMVMSSAEEMHMTMTEPHVLAIPDDRQSTYCNWLSEMLQHKNPQLVVCIVSNNRSDRYSAIKKICCVDRAVASQVITRRCLDHKNAQSIALKVAVQINCKLGGAPWTVDVPMRGTMIIGFDATSDTMNKSVSYGALVATLDINLSQYFATVSAHKTLKDLSECLSNNVLKALHKFKKNNGGQLPARIIIYRDGVGDGQIQHVQEHEIALVKERLAEVYLKTQYQLAVVVVSKRINTRIFTSDCRNPPPGTVVDSCITLPERFDFFIVSQNVRQGTVSPTSYNVIWDNTDLGPDKLQRLTYKLTYLYYNWSGTVRVPAPVQYAHKLAMLTGQALHRTPNEELENVLFFL